MMSGIDILTEGISSQLAIFAYIDPGSGSAIMSAIIGFVVAIGLAIKTYWYKIKGLFTGKKSSSDEKLPATKTESDKAG